MPGRIKIVDDARTPAEIETTIRRWIAEGFVPDMIVDDYPDLITPLRRHKEHRHELSEIYRWFRELGAPGHFTERGMAMVGATQSNRASLDKEIITEKDIAEDLGKAQIADIITAICQTPKEMDNFMCRLYGAKVRDGERGFMFDAKYYPASQAVITTGISKRREREEEV